MVGQRLVKRPVVITPSLHGTQVVLRVLRVRQKAAGEVVGQTWWVVGWPGHMDQRPRAVKKKRNPAAKEMQHSLALLRQLVAVPLVLILQLL